jgi:hypothetical protein
MRMHVLVRHNNTGRPLENCEGKGKIAEGSGHKKCPRRGPRAKTTSKKWRERKTEIDYRTHPLRSLGLLQLLTKLKKP